MAKKGKIKKMRYFVRRFAFRIIAAFLVLSFPFITLAGTMSSTSFVITSDDLNAGGGNSSSTSFVSESTAGGTATGENTSSTSFASCAGYPCTLQSEASEISFSVFPNVVLLDTLTSDMVITGSTTITTSMNSSSGYHTVAYTDGYFRTDNGAYVGLVSDGTVTAGSNEYGVGLVGLDRVFSDDRAITTAPLDIATNPSSVTNSSVDVIFKVAASGMNPAGSYRQTVTFVTTGSF